MNFSWNLLVSFPSHFPDFSEISLSPQFSNFQNGNNWSILRDISLAFFLLTLTSNAPTINSFSSSKHRLIRALLFLSKSGFVTCKHEHFVSRRKPKRSPRKRAAAQMAWPYRWLPTFMLPKTVRGSLRILRIYFNIRPHRVLVTLNMLLETLIFNRLLK